ncbi:TetR/AcrR family transcriptional regulator [Nocardia stercoris]|uniref:TetR/AcrR family transcriptional regulator n=2 Tax=Nocardia stercoris TaxID=2483361 RepID=A0A3M2L1N1_9NOCA|nr:TetR/AcrR family transcriptional regulator [Nocardia stercoris]
MGDAVRAHGYREATVADVVRLARTSRRTFYEHFSSKQDCYIALLAERNHLTVATIQAAVDVDAPWRSQVRQAVEAWIDVQTADPVLTHSWIRDVPAMGEASHALQRDTSAEFVSLVRALADTERFRAAGLRPPTRDGAVMLLGGFRELIATAVEDGRDITDIVDVAVDSAIALLLGPQRG